MAVLTRDTILRILNDYAPGIHGLKRIGLAGSYARDDFTEASDLDLVFDLDNERTDGTLTETAATLRLILMDQFRKELDIIKYDSEALTVKLMPVLKRTRVTGNIASHDYDSINWDIVKDISHFIIKTVTAEFLNDCVKICETEKSGIKDYT